MEPRPNYVLVGLFLVLFCALTVGVVAWIYGYRGGEETVLYVILTEESVDGLRVGSPVKYKGVDVGKVVGIDIDPKDSEVLRIFMRIKKGVPIHADSVANILPQGITGLSYISIKGGRKGKPYLVKLEGKVYPTIRLEPSNIQKISRSLPEILAHMDELVMRLNRTFSDENIKNISELSGRLVEVARRLEVVEEKTEELVLKLNALSSEAKRTLVDSRRLLPKAEALLGEVRRTSRALRELSESVKEVVEENKQEVSHSLRFTLYRLDSLLSELGRLSLKTERLLDTLEQDPSVVVGGVKTVAGPGEVKR